MNLKYIKKIKWNKFYESLKDYGLANINEKKANDLIILSGDSHTIPFRIMDNIPSWISNSIPIDIELIQLFAISPLSIGMVHKDGIDRLGALNIPVLNYKKGYMDWFEDNFNSRTYNNNYTRVRLTLDEDDNRPYRIEKIPEYQTTIDFPSVVNTNIWHRIDNRLNENYRWILSIRFKHNPSFEKLCSIFN